MVEIMLPEIDSEFEIPSNASPRANNTSFDGMDTVHSFVLSKVDVSVFCVWPNWQNVGCIIIYSDKSFTCTFIKYASLHIGGIDGERPGSTLLM